MHYVDMCAWAYTFCFFRPHTCVQSLHAELFLSLSLSVSQYLHVQQFAPDRFSVLLIYK